MAFDERLAERVRRALAPRRNVVEKKMFGGLCYMVGNHMACGIVDDKLMVRLSAEAAAELLQVPHVKPMDFTGRPLKGFLYVEAGGIRTAAQLKRWIERAAAHAESLPPKKAARR
jgi:TfoX/Sxy family transcriptional regulator of competence genes